MNDLFGEDPTAPTGAEAEGDYPQVSSIEDLIIYRLARVVGITQRIGHGWTSTLFGLSVNEWRMLGLVHGHEPIRAGDLAGLMLIDKSQLSRLIRMLNAKGYVKSQPDQDDARAIALRVTKKGSDLHDRMLAEATRGNRRFFAAFERHELVELDRLIDKMTAHGVGALSDLGGELGGGD